MKSIKSPLIMILLRNTKILKNLLKVKLKAMKKMILIMANLKLKRSNRIIIKIVVFHKMNNDLLLSIIIQIKNIIIKIL